MTTTRSRDSSGYDVYLEYDDVKVGFRLARSEMGLAWSRGLQPLLAEERRTSGTFDYQQVPAEVDVPLGFDNWSGGCGIDELSTLTSTSVGYNYSQYVDASYGDRLYLSPAFNQLYKTKASSTTIDAAPTFMAENSLGTYVCAGRYLYKYDTSNDQFDEVDDLGSGNAFTGPVREFNGKLYAPAGDDVDYEVSSDGTTWAASGATDDNAVFFTARGRTSTTPQFWKIDSSGNLKSATTPDGSGSTWSAAVPVGHTSETVNGLLTADDKVWIFKKEGVWFFDGSNVNDFWTGGRLMLRDSNGKNPLLWVDGFIYVPYGDRLMQIDPYEETFNMLYPTNEMLGNSELNGSITALAGDSDWIYLAQKNAAGNTYLIKINPYRTVHTWNYQGSNDCNALLVTGAGAVADSNPSVLAGYASTIGNYINPRAGMRPDDDENYLYTTNTGVIVGPRLNVGAKLFKKFLSAGRVLGASMTAAATAVLRYEIDEASPETIVTADNDGESFAVFTNEVEFNQIRYNMQMTTGSETASPVVNSVVLNTILNPPRRKSWTFSVTVNSGVVLSGGGRASMSGNYLETFLFGGVQKRVTLYDRRGDRTYVGRIINVNGRIMQPMSDGDLEVFDVMFYEIADTTSGDVAIYNKDAYNVGKVYA
tara:strand:+ start:2486 stop:4429 length:1944 start_codon:yes stop_codon:yes gene_type:complete